MAVSPSRQTLQSGDQIACIYFEQSGIKTAHNLELPRQRHSVSLAAMNTKTAFDLIFRNARIRSATSPVDIGVSGGRIAAIAPRLECEAAEIDVGGRLALPGFVDTHIHLDKACLLGRCGHDHGSVSAAIAAVAAMKRDFTGEDVYA